MTKIIKLFYCLLFVVLLTGCTKQKSENEIQTLPVGFNIWVMNDEEIYIANKNNELLVGPSLRNVAITNKFIIAFCDSPPDKFEGYTTTVKYSAIDITSGSVKTNLSVEAVKELLKKNNENFPVMSDYNNFRPINR